MKYPIDAGSTKAECDVANWSIAGGGGKNAAVKSNKAPFWRIACPPWSMSALVKETPKSVKFSEVSEKYSVPDSVSPWLS